jgi:hypothetical protein
MCEYIVNKSANGLGGKNRVNRNITIGSLPTPQIPLGIVALFEKINIGEPILTVVSNTVSGRMYNTVVSIKCMMWNVCCSPTLYADIGKQLLFANNSERVRGAD